MNRGTLILSQILVTFLFPLSVNQHFILLHTDPQRGFSRAAFFWGMVVIKNSCIT